jgi:ABC-type glycerol-3-phosphate transport system substrate-binding protein
MKKIFLYGTIFCFVFYFGCGQQAKVRKKTITIWHWMTDRQDAFQELAKRYEQETGVKVNFELYGPSDAYSSKIMAAAQAKALPDIYGLLGEKRLFAAFIEAGHVLDLTESMEANNSSWKRIFFAKALEVNEFRRGNDYGVKPGIYGVPIDVTNIQMLYNKDLFKELGLDPNRPPRDWDEFIAVGERLKGRRLLGLVSGWAETWLIDCFASNYAFNIMGEDKVIKTIEGKIPYTDPDWIRVFSLFKELKDSGLINDSIVTMGNKTAEQLFANGRAVFAFNGSWCVNVYRGMNPQLNYGAFLPPMASNKYFMRVWGGAGSSLLINGRSPNKKEAVKFLKWLTAKPQQEYLARATLNLPANKDCLGNIPEILSQFASAMDNTTHPNILPVQEKPLVIETLTKGIQAIIIGVKTPRAVAEEVQGVKIREMKKCNAK